MLLYGLLLLVAAFIVVWLMLRASLPQLNGTLTCDHLAAPLQIDRDGMGVVTLLGEDRCDVAYALGYAHAQDRRFQMDLYRRLSAGELAALLGKGALASDVKMRVHGFRAVAKAALTLMPEHERSMLEKYAEGVNEATSRFRMRPFEYLLLRSRPEPWRAEDSILVNFSMFALLQSPMAINKVQRGLIAQALPKAVADFVYQEASTWSAALDESLLLEVPIPDSAQWDVRKLAGLNFEPPKGSTKTLAMQGSNAFVVGQRHSKRRGALVANDMHLGLSIPNIWYRARLVAKSESIDVTGVTLPGAPFVLAGSNGHMGWALTNSFADFQEVIICMPDPNDPGRYLTADGSQAFVHKTEVIAVKGKKPIALDVLATHWGPIIGKDAKGRFLSLQWTAHRAEAGCMGVQALERTTSVADALTIASVAGTPGVNFLVGDASGQVGWTLMGKIPEWKTLEHNVPKLSTDPLAGFDRLLPGSLHPTVTNLPWIVSANHRHVGGASLAVLGDGGYDLGIRAWQIQEGIRKKTDGMTEDDLHALQLDDRALLLSWWHTRLLRLLNEDAVAASPKRKLARDALLSFSHTAAVDELAYPLVRDFRLHMLRKVFFAMIAPARVQNPQFEFTPPASFEGPLMLVLQKEPLHLLPPPFATWHSFELRVVDEMLSQHSAKSMVQRTWGRVNNVQIRHVLSQGLPGLGWLLDMPHVPMPGDENMPRVNCPEVGASERMVVCVGEEEKGIFTMPGGQSGHPLSPFYRAGHAEWVNGQRLPFLATEPIHTLRLAPGALKNRATSLQVT